ncbi:MAG: PilW family protein [Methylococcaceae bacterium]|nr:PilW family protein [Methylococcaceae bacterium]
MSIPKPAWGAALKNSAALPERISIASSQRGLSLVEIMVALTLSLVLTAAALGIYLSSRQAYRSSDAMARIQENTRYAFEIMGRDLRMAGYRGCAGSATNTVNTLNSASDFLWNFNQPIYGYEATTASSWNVVPLDASIVSPLGGRDIVVLRGAFGSGIRVLQQPGGLDPGSADLKVTANSDLEAGDIVMVTDCLAAAIFQITNSNTAGGFDNEVHNTGNLGGMIPGNATKTLGKNFEGGEIMKISTKAYYIRNNPAGQPSLYRKEGTADAQEMVEGVQDMQILYGVDTNGDTAADSYKTAEGVQNDGQWDNVVAARVSLLLRSPEDNIVTPHQAYNWYKAPRDTTVSSTTAADYRLYQISETTFTLRNRVN